MYFEAADVRLTYEDFVVLPPFNVDIYKLSYGHLIFPNGEFLTNEICLFLFDCLEAY